jgi:Gamma-glutamyl cyclotransferase, AIG2-like
VPLYFAYGSNMDVNAMARRCPRSKALGLARLERHRLAVMREGWLTAVRASSSAVHGVLWDLALSDIPALDRHESLSQSLYVKLIQAVIAE